jgi:peptidoglycan/LPS O-acetylase OafA/YrhL
LGIVPISEWEKMSTQSSFIPHIAGLRGIAVILVVLGHFGIPGFASGFIGVDVFFVISGFLITGILVDEYERSRDPETRVGSISLKNFYLRRARRILPASIVVTISIVLFSWFTNNIARFGTIVGDAIWSTLFSANLNFAIKATDYFQIGAAPSPFQHFWSLAVEEQFYFIWPTLILGALTLRALRCRGKLVNWQNRLSVLFVAMTVLSILVMVVSFTFQPTLSYFLTVSRAWELSIGALGALAVRYYPEFLTKVFPHPVRRWAPFALVAASMFFITSNNFGYTLPLIVLASLMVVIKEAGSQDWDAKLLSTKPISFIGNISYSLYLWHWPVFTFATEMGFTENYAQKAFLIGLSIVLATLSYYFVELKFQKIALPKFRIDTSVPLSKPKWLTGSVALLIGLYALPAVAVQPATQTYLASFFDARPGAEDFFPSLSPTPTRTKPATDGDDWFNRRQEEIQSSIDALAKAGKLSDIQISELNRVADGKSYASGAGFTCNWGDCTLGKPNAKLRILLLGDSHALMLQPTFYELAKSGKDLYVRSMTSGSCVNVKNSRSMLPFGNMQNVEPCVEMHNQIEKHLDSLGYKYDLIILSDGENFIQENYVADATVYASYVSRHGKKTIIVGQAPYGGERCLNKDYSNYQNCSASKRSSIHDFQTAKRAGVQYADLGSLFCVKNFCPLLIGDAPVSGDYHLTDASARGIAPYFLEFLESAEVPTSN